MLILEIFHSEMSSLTLQKNGLLELIEDEQALDIEENTVLVKPLCVGICSSDIPRAFANKAYFYPIIIGHEFSAIVEDDPSNKFEKGTRCAVFPLLPCFKCASCKKKKYNMCKQYSYYGSRTNGGLQSKLYIKHWNLLEVPQAIDNVSASLIEPISVCVHAYKKVSEKKSILIYGGGFLSQIISQLLIKKNCKITVIDRNPYKQEFFDDNINFKSNEDSLEESSFDLTIECCGANGVIAKCIKYTKPEGKILQMANPESECKIESNDISQLMRKEQIILGTWNSDYRPDNYQLCDWRKTLELLRNEEINISKLISHQANLTEAQELLKNIHKRKSGDQVLKNYNKAIVHINS